MAAARAAGGQRLFGLKMFQSNFFALGKPGKQGVERKPQGRLNFLAPDDFFTFFHRVSRYFGRHKQAPVPERFCGGGQPSGLGIAYSLSRG